MPTGYTPGIMKEVFMGNSKSFSELTKEYSALSAHHYAVQDFLDSEMPNARPMRFEIRGYDRDTLADARTSFDIEPEYREAFFKFLETYQRISVARLEEIRNLLASLNETERLRLSPEGK